MLEDLGIALIFVLQFINLIFSVIGFCAIFNIPVIVSVIIWVVINLGITCLGFYLITKNARED